MDKADQTVQHSLYDDGQHIPSDYDDHEEDEKHGGVPSAARAQTEAEPTVSQDEELARIMGSLSSDIKAKTSSRTLARDTRTVIDIPQFSAVASDPVPFVKFIKSKLTARAKEKLISMGMVKKVIAMLNDKELKASTIYALFNCCIAAGMVAPDSCTLGDLSKTRNFGGDDFQSRALMWSYPVMDLQGVPLTSPYFCVPAVMQVNPIRAKLFTSGSGSRGLPNVDYCNLLLRVGDLKIITGLSGTIDTSMRPNPKFRMNLDQDDNDLQSIQCTVAASKLFVPVTPLQALQPGYVASTPEADNTELRAFLSSRGRNNPAFEGKSIEQIKSAFRTKSALNNLCTQRTNRSWAQGKIRTRKESRTALPFGVATISVKQMTAQLSTGGTAIYMKFTFHSFWMMSEIEGMATTDGGTSIFA